MRATEAASGMFKERFPQSEFMWASVGGPVGAMDLSRRMSSVSVYGITNKKLEDMVPHLSTDYYRIVPEYDITGVEVSSTFKNIYSIAPGICDGLYKSSMNNYYFNFTALLYSKALTEIFGDVKYAGGMKKNCFWFCRCRGPLCNFRCR